MNRAEVLEMLKRDENINEQLRGKLEKIYDEQGLVFLANSDITDFRGNKYKYILVNKDTMKLYAKFDDLHTLEKFCDVFIDY